MNTLDHWQMVYSRQEGKKPSWYQDRPECSLALIRAARLDPECAVIDVGGGASTLVDCLLGEGFSDLTVLDIAATGLQEARRRLGPRAGSVHWLEQDIMSFIPFRRYGLWHDRALFHFLTGAQDRQIYCDVLRSALGRGGNLVIATFAPGGPQKCSGLNIVQYDATQLSRELGRGFQLQQQIEEDHLTPDGCVQRFAYYRFLRD